MLAIVDAADDRISDSFHALKKKVKFSQTTTKSFAFASTFVTVKESLQTPASSNEVTPSMVKDSKSRRSMQISESSRK